MFPTDPVLHRFLMKVINLHRIYIDDYNYFEHRREIPDDFYISVIPKITGVLSEFGLDEIADKYELMKFQRNPAFYIELMNRFEKETR